MIARPRKLDTVTEFDICEEKCCKPDTPAVWEIPVDEDSFGPEWMGLCETHYYNYLAGEPPEDTRNK